MTRIAPQFEIPTPDVSVRIVSLKSALSELPVTVAAITFANVMPHPASGSSERCPPA